MRSIEPGRIRDVDCTSRNDDVECLRALATPVIASAAKQSSFVSCGAMDCFAALAMTEQHACAWLFETPMGKSTAVVPHKRSAMRTHHQGAKFARKSSNSVAE